MVVFGENMNSNFIKLPTAMNSLTVSLFVITQKYDNSF